MNYNLNKADYYIRFYPVNTQYIRIRFKQNSFNSIKTLFGYKYQYLIGLREITFKQDEYDITGEYVSLPYSTGKTINSVLFNRTDISNNDIKYMVSANGGGKWILIKDNNQSIQLLDENVGVLETTDIKNIRIKILMDKANSNLNTRLATEFATYNLQNRYYMKESLSSVIVSCGRHLSFGREYTYDEQVSNNFLDKIVLLGVPYSIATMKDIDGITPMLTVFKDSDFLDNTNYTITEDDNKQNSIINLNVPITSYMKVSVSLKPFLYTSQLQNIVKLPSKSFYDNKYEFFITEYVGEVCPTGGDVLTGGDILPFEAYDIINNLDTDSTSIVIHNNYFKKGAIYSIKYIPSFRISNTIDIDTNQISISSLSLYNNSQLRFDYVYDSEYDINLIKYYTPIVNEYSVEMI